MAELPVFFQTQLHTSPPVTGRTGSRGFSAPGQGRLVRSAQGHLPATLHPTPLLIKWIYFIDPSSFPTLLQ